MKYYLIIFGLLALLFCWFFYLTVFRYLYLRFFGKSVEGEVVGLERSASMSFSALVPTVKFLTDNDNKEHVFLSRPALFLLSVGKSRKVGQKLRVYYNKNNASKVVAEDPISVIFYGVIFGFIAVLLIRLVIGIYENSL